MYFSVGDRRLKEISEMFYSNCDKWPRVLLGLLALTLLSTPKLFAEEWPCWRGPRGDGTSEERGLIQNWSASENVVWKTPLTIAGHSSPIVYGNQVIIVGSNNSDETRELASFERTTGKVQWRKTVIKSPLEEKHKLNSYASGTPATDGERIYTTFLDQHDMVVAAYTLQGEPLWLVRPGTFSSKHGYCSSPVLYKDKVIVNGDHDGESYIVALDRKTGETLWKTEREFKTRSYCTPIIREIAGRTQLMLSGSKCVASYDPDTGKQQWIIDGPTEQFVASPVYHHKLLIITGGFPDKHIIAIDPTGEGNISKSNIKWHHLRRGVSYVPSPIAVGDYFVITSDDGIGSCFDIATGKLLWQERMGRHYSGSLVATADDLIYATDDDGVTKVIKPGEKHEILATNKLGEEIYSSPAISRGQIFLRGTKHLWCLGR
jgi:outer membrane protein assembly factor BamB